MNTKGIKFLAVLAVMVMAFAAIAVLAPADKDVTAIDVYGNKDVVVDPTVIDGNTSKNLFYISDDATVKIKNMTGISPSEVTFYVQNGKELELDFKASSDSAVMDKTIIIVTVTGDQQRDNTTSYVDDSSHNNPIEERQKVVLSATEFKFTGENKQNVVYKAMMPKTVKTVTTSGGFITDVTSGYGNYAYVSVSNALKTAASANSRVAVAPGQYIETENIPLSDLVYGIEVKKLPETTTTTNANAFNYTYYAEGMNAGTETLKSSETVTIKNGSIIANNGNATVKANSVIWDYSASVVLSVSADNQIDVAGNLDYGSMTVSGGVKFATTIGKNATVTFNSSASAVDDSDLTINGYLILKNENSGIAKMNIHGTGFIVAENEKLWTYDTTTNKPSLVFKNSTAASGFFSGQFDVTAISKKADVEDAFSTAKIEKNQTFRMVGDTIIAEEFIIEGTLYIEPGVTLTITQTNDKGASVTVLGQYAQIVNNGTIVIKTTTPLTASTPIGLHVIGGAVLNYGTINASSLKGAEGTDTLVVDWDGALPTGYATVTRGGYGFVNYNTMSVGKYDTANLDSKFTNSVLGTFTVGSGTLVADSMVNGGLFTINNGTIKTTGSNAFTVTMDTGAEFKIISADVAQGAKIIVQNKLSGTTPANFISLEAPTASGDDTVRISNFTVTDTSKPLASKYKLDLSGNLSVSLPKALKDLEKTVKIDAKGNVDVTANLTINNGYDLIVTNDTTWTVSGKVTIAKEVTVDIADENKMQMTITGTVTDASGDLKGNDGFKYIGAMFTNGNDADIYTTLNDAVPAAVQAEVGQIYVGSDLTVKGKEKFVTVTEDLAIPEGITVEGEYLEVDDMATIAVLSGGRFSFDAIVIQSGMITAADVNDIDFQLITADVMIEDDETTAAACMSLEVALMLATPGDVIELSHSFYTADSTLVIPEGVTVDATKVKDKEPQFAMVNSDLIVNGKLIVSDFRFVATTDDTIGITVNGYIYDKCSDGKCFVPWWYNPFGVSYLYTDAEDNTWFVLTTIENIQPAINVADDAKVNVEGDAKLDELTVSGREDMPATVTFKGNVEIGVINVDDTTLKFTNGKKISTTVKDALGSITIIGAYADDNLSIYSLDDEGVYMAGTVIDTPDKEEVTPVASYLIRFDGITGMDGTNRANIDWVDETKTPVIVFNGTTTVIGKKAKIGTGEEPTGIATITGTLYVDHMAKLAINTDVEVLGALVAAEKTEEEPTVGSIETNGNVFIGMLVSDLYDMDYYPPQHYNLAGVAMLAGNVSLTEGFFIYVAPNSIVDPAIVEDLDSMNLYVDTELWFTLYGYENKHFNLNGLMIPMENARVYDILDGNLEEIDCDLYPDTINVIRMDADDARSLSDYGAVYITLDYYIFEVKIKTDGSVKAVYIDGILMETGNVANIFTMMNVAAGTHKVTVEAATGYDADKCVLYTELGTILPGMAFTFTEYDVTEYDFIIVDDEDVVKVPVVVYNINGTEIQPEPVPPTPEEESQWTITTILLVILVVLIAIMAVIVALRLNRS